MVAAASSRASFRMRSCSEVTGDADEADAADAGAGAEVRGAAGAGLSRLKFSNAASFTALLMCR